eukprot:82045_1
MTTVGLIENVDKGLAIYFQRFDKQYTGNFANWADEYGFENEYIAGEFHDNSDPHDCLVIDYVDEIDEFPLQTSINDIKNRNIEIYFLLKHCYEFGTPPSQYMNNKSVNLLDESQITVTEKDVKSVPGVSTAFTSDYNAIFLLRFSLHYKQPILLNFVDLYDRYKLYDYLQSDPSTYENYPLKDVLIKRCKPFNFFLGSLDRLSDHENKHNAYKPKLSHVLLNAIGIGGSRDAFFWRGIHKMTMGPTPTGFRINDNLIDFMQYTLGVNHYVSTIIDDEENIFPFQLEICFIPRNDDSYDVDDKNDDNNIDIDILNDNDTELEQALRYGKINYYKQEITETNLKDMNYINQDGYNAIIQRLFKNAEFFKNIKLTKGKRIIILIDRRLKKKLNGPSCSNTIYIFEPNTHNTVSDELFEINICNHFALLPSTTWFKETHHFSVSFSVYSIRCVKLQWWNYYSKMRIFVNDIPTIWRWYFNPECYDEKQLKYIENNYEKYVGVGDLPDDDFQQFYEQYTLQKIVLMKSTDTNVQKRINTHLQPILYLLTIKDEIDITNSYEIKKILENKFSRKLATKIFSEFTFSRTENTLQDETHTELLVSRYAPKGLYLIISMDIIRLIHLYLNSAKDGDLIVQSGQTIILKTNYEYEFKNIIIKSGGILTTQEWRPELQYGGCLMITCLNNIILENKASIVVNGMGYKGGTSGANGEG